MTKKSDLKKKIRARMAKTGERYTTARAHVLAAEKAQANAPENVRIGGEHDQTASLRDLLLAAAVDMPHTGEPPTEALLLGLGGGLGAAMFTFEYAGHLPHLYIETRVSPQYGYDAAFVLRAIEGLGLTAETHETGGAKGARKKLDGLLAEGRTLMTWVDKGSLPNHPTMAQAGAMPWTVVAHEANDDGYVVSDLSVVTHTIDADAFAVARGAYKKAKNRLLWLTSTEVGDVASGVRASIARCAEELAGREVRKGYVSNFGLRALEKWADLIDARTKKGWRKVFVPGPALANGLRQAYHWIETSGTGGAGFRSMYAQFLREGALLCDDSTMNDVAARYDNLAEQWHAFAASLLPDGSPLGEIRERLHTRQAAIRAGKPADAIAEHDAAIDALVVSCEPFPGDAEAVYDGMSAALREIITAEYAAAEALAGLVG